MTKSTGVGRGNVPPARCTTVHHGFGACVRNAGIEGHEMVQQKLGELEQPLLIHVNADGRMWTLLGPYPPPRMATSMRGKRT